MRHSLLSLLVLLALACRDDQAATTRPVTYRVPTRTLDVEEANRLLWRPGVPATFAPSTADERQAIAGLVAAMTEAAGAPRPPDPGPWEETAWKVGFRVEAWQVEDHAFWALIELPDRRRGAGAYLFRLAPRADTSPELLLQAPHAYFDRGTDELAAELFFRPPAGPRPRALFTNTIHRYASEDGKRVKRADSPADVCHNPAHVFQAATEAFADAVDRAIVLQLHGFSGDVDSQDDGTGPPPGTIMVVSSGDVTGLSPTAMALANELRVAFGDGVRRFPTDVGVLGATTNAQRRGLARRANTAFVHVELSASLRTSLLGDEAALARFGQAILAARPGTE